MALKVKPVHVSDAPYHDRVPENAALSLRSPFLNKCDNEDENEKSGFKFPKFMVVGHRGNGMNMMQSADGRMKSIKENSVRSFNAAAGFPIDFIEFDVQADKRRNSFDEAIMVGLGGGMQGIVSEVKAVFRNSEAVSRIKESKLALITCGSKLALITYGQLNNVPDIACVQPMMGVEGVIVDLVKEITEAVSDISPSEEGEEGKSMF